MNAAVPRSRSTDKRLYGVMEAVVTANDDPDGLGRVKLRIPSVSEHTEHEWCRVRQSYAGKGYGAFFVPEVNDEVLVAFIHGDLTKAVVLGSLYSKPRNPATKRDAMEDRKQIRTMAGHEITLDDTEGKLRIEIRDAHRANSIVIDTEANSITIEAAKGKLVLKGKGVEIESKADVKITASGTMDLKGTTININ